MHEIILPSIYIEENKEDCASCDEKWGIVWHPFEKHTTGTTLRKIIKIDKLIF